MKQIKLSYLVTGILLLKILGLVKMFKDIDQEKRFFFFFLKILSLNLKRIFFVDLNMKFPNLYVPADFIDIKVI